MTRFIYDYFHLPEEARAYQAFEKEYLKEKLDVLKVDDGIILPHRKAPNGGPWMGLGGIVDSDGRFVDLSAIPGFDKNEGSFVFGGLYEYNPDDVAVVDEEVLYMGIWQPHWGHFLLEYMTRLWYWVKYRPDTKIAYMAFNNNGEDINGNYLMMLELMGIKEEQLVKITTPTRFKRIIVPEQSFLRWKYYSHEYQSLIQVLKEEAAKRVNIQTFDKIYFTREFFAKNKERGENRVSSTFLANGYKVVAPEKLSTLEQIYLISHCKSFAVAIGGASMNAVFAAPGCELIMIKKAFPDLDADIHVVAPSCEADRVFFVDCYRKPFKSFPASAGGGPHLYGVTEELNRFFEDNKMKTANPEGLVEHFIDRVWLSKLWMKHKLSKTRSYQLIKRMIRNS